MSLKDDYLSQVRQARTDHKKWVNQIRVIVSGLQNDKNIIALNPSEDSFGMWLYSKAMAYSISNSKLVLNDMESLFDACYNQYHKIYAVLFKEESGSIFSSLFGSKKASISDYKLANQYYEILLEKSDQLLNKLRIFENQLTATNFEKFESVLSSEQNSVKEEITPKKKEQRYYRGSLIEN
ncbi:MAG TPA: hypothetical protein CFH84_01055 [Sulfurimonas sp. UBA12504]|nr:MAG: hypothetical protein A2019_09070 [Sulfurimonas sp. GWF2_37_8]DAB30981.1 MAG TPA: hypothetical protein CFH84_01055 [Sulfurimonas sp. UBA12504]